MATPAKEGAGKEVAVMGDKNVHRLKIIGEGDGSLEAAMAIGFAAGHTLGTAQQDATAKR